MTIKDVAKRAGVSVTTVSRVLNKEFVSENRRLRVEEAIQELGYVPNDHARKLAQSKLHEDETTVS